MEEQLIALYKDIRQLSNALNLSTYPAHIARLKKRYADLFEALRIYLDHPQNPLDSISCCVAKSVSKDMQRIASKQKRKMASIDNNMAMVSYFLPLIRDIESPRAKELATLMAEAWNEAFPDTHISGMTIDEVKGGFKSSPCFITTAACNSLGKPDGCYELTLLRRFRDTYMMSSEEKSNAVQTYYRVAPMIVENINKAENPKEIYASIWNRYLAPCIRLIEENRLFECEAVYVEMVNRLQMKFA